MSARVVPATAVGELEHLAGLAERIFGRGDRAPGWFSRKLRRECVVAERSLVAVDPGGDPRDPRSWLGMMLVGTPASVAPYVRTAGTGVVGEHRRTGIGRALLERACAAARDHRDAGLETWADDPAVGFYLAHGCVVVRRVVHLLGTASGGALVGAPGPEPWEPDADHHSLHEAAGFLAEAWTLSETPDRMTLRSGPAADAAIAHVCREGTAFVVHRLLVSRPGGERDALGRLLALLPRPSPVIVAGAHAGWADAGAVGPAGFRVVQTASIVRWQAA